MGMDSGDLSDFVENVEWECHGMPAVRNVIMYGCCSDPYPDITYTLHLKRRSLFYIFNLLLPCFLISFLGTGFTSIIIINIPRYWYHQHHHY